MNCINEQKLISASDCLEFLIDKAINTQKTEIVKIKYALDRVITNDIVANINVPNFDNSAMDGYAINLVDGLKPPYTFKLKGRIAAGEIGKKLAKNCAVKIFTGAKLPTGANCVAIQEQTEKIDDYVEVFGFLKKGENIRLQGDDIQNGTIILSAGKKLTPSDVGLCASIGISKVKVFTKLIVGVFFSGNEIIEPEEVLTDGKIYNSNRYSINALLQKLNCDIIDFGNIADNFNNTCKALNDLSKQCDVIITTGGVSVGEEDHIKPAVKSLGSIEMWAIKMKPGKPLAYGRVNNIHFIGLPGNPVSSMATFHLFITPFLRKLSGNNNYKNSVLKAQISLDIPSRFRREFVRVRLDNSTVPPTAILYKNQSSGVLSSMSWADGLLEIPDEQRFKKNDILNYYPLL